MDLPTWFLLRAKIKRHHGYPHHPQQKAPAPVYDRQTGPRSSAQATWRARGIGAEEKEAEISKSTSWERGQSAVSPSRQWVGVSLPSPGGTGGAYRRFWENMTWFPKRVWSGDRSQLSPGEESRADAVSSTSSRRLKAEKAVGVMGHPVQGQLWDS